MKNILYLNNYMSNAVTNIRKNSSFFSQPANNKIIGICKAIASTNNNVTILSSGLVNNKSLKKYKIIYDKVNETPVVYCEIIDIPLINTLSSILYMYRQIKKMNKEKKIDNIIFYNYKPEVAWAALLAKKKLKIPITVEFEDGYSSVSNISRFKAFIFKITEKKVSKNIDSAILVNSILKSQYKVPTVVVRGIVDKNFYEECKKYKKKRNEIFTIFYSGGLDEDRGIKVLIQSLKYIEHNVRLIITGKGKIDFEDDRIQFKGFVSYDEMKKLMMQSDVLIQCQLTNNGFNYVSFPSKIFEYIATNNFIISSKVADITDFSENEIMYYDNDNPKDLADKIMEIYKRWEKGESTNVNFDRLCKENLPESIGYNIIKILG